MSRFHCFSKLFDVVLQVGEKGEEVIAMNIKLDDYGHEKKK